MARAYAIFTKIIFGIVIIIAIILLLKKEFIAAIVSLLAGFLYLFPALAIADLSDQNEILRLNLSRSFSGLENFSRNFSELEINFFTDSKLLSKFNVEYWDEFKNVHCLKFLIKYSSIFSKFIEPEELNEVEFEQVEKIEPISRYIEIDGEKFFDINDITYDSCFEKTITILKDENFFKKYKYLFEKRD